MKVASDSEYELEVGMQFDEMSRCEEETPKENEDERSNEDDTENGEQEERKEEDDDDNDIESNELVFHTFSNISSVSEIEPMNSWSKTIVLEVLSQGLQTLFTNSVKVTKCNRTYKLAIVKIPGVFLLSLYIFIVVIVDNFNYS